MGLHAVNYKAEYLLNCNTKNTVQYETNAEIKMSFRGKKKRKLVSGQSEN
jgi:hypothetical protein